LFEILPKGFNSLRLTDPVDGGASTSFVYGGFSAQSGHRGRDTSVNIVASL